MLSSRFRCRISRLRTGMTRGWGRGQMAGKTRAIAYWLLPEAAAREVFLREIRRLARQFGAPLFEPHVTIFIAPENSRAPLEVLHEVGPVDAIWKASGMWGDRYLIEPHLSLLYAKLPSKTNQRLADNIRLPFREVGFTSICVMRCARPTTRAIEVEQWKLLAP